MTKQTAIGFLRANRESVYQAIHLIFSLATPKINDILDLKEIEHDDVKMGFLTQSFTSEVKTWYRGLVASFIRDYAAFETSFLDKWEEKKNPQHLLTQYKKLQKNPNETIQEFSNRFMKQ